MKALQSITERAVIDLLSLTDKTIPFPYKLTAHEATTKYKADKDQFGKDNRWAFFSPCIGEDPKCRVSLKNNPVTSTEGYVIQDDCICTDLAEAVKKADSFTIQPTFIGLGLDNRPLYIFLFKAPIPVDYNSYRTAAKALAQTNKINATKESFSPSTYWPHSYNFQEFPNNLTEAPKPSVNEATTPTAATPLTLEQLQARAKAIADTMWHEATTNSYWFADKSGQIRKRSENHARAEFISSGVSTSARKGISKVDAWLKYVRDHNSVDGVVESPFRPIGPFCYAGRRILNSSEISHLKPAPSCPPKPSPDTNPRSTAWEKFCAFQEALFGHEQIPFIDALVARTYLSLVNKTEDFKQAAILSGPANTGKTLWVHNVVCALLGGRSANLRSYLLTNGNFTESLFRSPIGILDDQAHDQKEQAKFTSLLKNLISSKYQEFHAKFMPEQGITWQGGVWILCNLDPDSFISSIPNLSMSILDKVHLIKAQTPPGFDFTDIDKIIAEALPYYARYLIDNAAAIAAAVAPRGTTTQKYGITPYHNPELLKNTYNNTNSIEIQEILELLANDFPNIYYDFRQCTATKIKNLITSEPRFENLIRHHTPKSVGEALVSLSKTCSWIVVHSRGGSNSNTYTINLPSTGVTNIPYVVPPKITHPYPVNEPMPVPLPLPKPEQTPVAEVSVTDHKPTLTEKVPEPPAQLQRQPQASIEPKALIRDLSVGRPLYVHGPGISTPDTAPTPAQATSLPAPTAQADTTQADKPAAATNYPQSSGYKPLYEDDEVPF